MSFFSEYVALDIGTNSVKLFAIDQGPSSQGYQLHTFLQIPLTPGLVSGGFTNPAVTSIPEFSHILRRQFIGSRSMKHGLIVGLPDRWVKLHLIEAIFRPEEVSSPDYMNWRLRKQLCPPGLGEVLADYQIAGQQETDEGTRYRLIVGLVAKEIIDLLSQMFLDMQVQVMAFDTSTLGVFNLFEEFFPDRACDRNVAFCHIGHETTVVKVFHQGSLQYERVIEVGGEAFNRIYADAQGLTPSAGEAEIFRHRLFPLTRAEILNMVGQRQLFERIFGNWLRELQVTFRFYQDKFQVRQLPSLYLTGGACLFPGLPEFLGDFFAVPCQRFNPLTKLPFTADIDPQTMEQGPLMAPAIGLLMK
jgi:Tfp pilus assembly PilM family ATPase